MSVSSTPVTLTPHAASTESGSEKVRKKVRDVNETDRKWKEIKKLLADRESKALQRAELRVKLTVAVERLSKSVTRTNGMVTDPFQHLSQRLAAITSRLDGFQITNQKFHSLIREKMIEVDDHQTEASRDIEEMKRSVRRALKNALRLNWFQRLMAKIWSTIYWLVSLVSPSQTFFKLKQGVNVSNSSTKTLRTTPKNSSTNSSQLLSVKPVPEGSLLERKTSPVAIVSPISVNEKTEPPRATEHQQKQQKKKGGRSASNKRRIKLRIE
ncbi:unnamed protein product [Caenorhabditis auriculariae]|uniref:Uncharacterized protein n=1 Tax=Caenorhabditis auriculariae TaxID=2777116 RepID=A0A8S1H319_9PELO|nr:unnamed protein product [Caenorhabditis auriculariae]